MCIIVMKERGIDVPNIQTLKTCFENNPDGAGILFHNPGHRLARIHKGFMTWASFEDALHRLPITKQTQAVFHFRITTAGGTSPQNCHPFPISNAVNDLKALEIETDKAIIHNGIIGQGTQSLSDTQLFIRNLVAQEPFAHSLHLATTHKALEALTQGSRLVIVDSKHDTFVRTGSGWIQDKQDVWFSNSGYKPFVRYGQGQQGQGQQGQSKTYDYTFEDYYNTDIPETSILDNYNGDICPNCQDELNDIGYYHHLLECPSCGYLYQHDFKTLFYDGDKF